MGFLSREALESMGFRHLGVDVSISDKASFHGIDRIAVGDQTRIDDFCVLSAGIGGIEIGRHVHIACFSSLIGAGKIRVEDYANLSARVSVFSSSDDYSGETMTNPTIPPSFKNVSHGPVSIGRHVIIGAGSVVLPNVTVADGCAIGALSLVNRNCAEFTVYAGIPAKRLKPRSKRILELEADFESFETS
jgi:dTDP-4-amino-4,6-dideoxy-D-glucose acyltransferase